MSKPQDRVISQRSDGRWANKRNDASRASSLHGTQAEAIATGKAMLAKQGGGEVTIQGRDNQFRAKDTVKPGNDPRKTRG